MKKIFLLATLALFCGTLAAQDVTNRYSMKLKKEADGSYSLINQKRYEAILDLSAVPDLLVPYTHESKRLKSSAYKGCEVREFVYKTYPGYTLSLQVDMAKSDAPAPFMVYLHGGGWARGNFGTNRDLSQYLAMQDGVAGVRIAYTLAPQTDATIEVSMQDVKDAVKFIQEHAAELNIDPARFGFMGGSAGAHLAAITAMTTPGTKVLVGTSGIYDLEKAAITAKAKDPQRVKYFKDKDPKVLRAASPALNVPSKNIPAVLLIHGTGDITVEYRQSEIFAEALKKKGATAVEVELYKNYDHNLTAKASDMKEDTFFKAHDFIVKHIF